MRSLVDLHTHSTASDGALGPAELIRFADGRRLAAVALTDHDTTDGLAEARAAADELTDLHFIPGIEISGKFPAGTLHILGLGIDEKAPKLRAVTARLRHARQQRNPKMIAKLQQLGLDIAMDDVLAVASEIRHGRAGRIIGRLHMAETLRRKGCVKTTGEAFAKYVGSEGAAYVDKERLWPREAIGAINDAGGVAVLAHPAQLNCRNRAQLERIVRELVAMGLGGIEAYHTDHTAAQTRLHLELAGQYHLLPTGGSDFHGAAKPEARLGRPPVPLSTIASSPFAPRLLGEL